MLVDLERGREGGEERVFVLREVMISWGCSGGERVLLPRGGRGGGKCRG